MSTLLFSGIGIFCVMKYTFGADNCAIYNDLGESFAQIGCGIHGWKN